LPDRRHYEERLDARLELCVVNVFKCRRDEAMKQPPHLYEQPVVNCKITPVRPTFRFGGVGLWFAARYCA
jgi:hypothetical protein